MAPLAECLPRAPSLTNLGLSFNRISDKAVEALLEASGGCACPRVALDVEGNDITVSLFRRVCKAAAVIELGCRVDL